MSAPEINAAEKEARITDHREVDIKRAKGFFEKFIASHNENVMNPLTLIGALRHFHHVICFTIVIAVILCSNADASCHKAINIQHELRDQPGFYRSGREDLFFLAFWAIALTGLRWLFSEYVLGPIASFLRVDKDKLGRFKDYGWQCMSIILYMFHNPSPLLIKYIIFSSLDFFVIRCVLYQCLDLWFKLVVEQRMGSRAYSW